MMTKKIIATLKKNPNLRPRSKGRLPNRPLKSNVALNVCIIDCKHT